MEMKTRSAGKPYIPNPPGRGVAPLDSQPRENPSFCGVLHCSDPPESEVAGRPKSAEAS